MLAIFLSVRGTGCHELGACRSRSQKKVINEHFSEILNSTSFLVAGSWCVPGGIASRSNSPIRGEPDRSSRTQTPEQLQQLVAPIALYPDSLVAQVLAASTFPEQVVEAARWVQSHPDLKGEALAQSVDQMPWDPSVKALVTFPSVLGNMDKNLSWTSSLGDAYYNQEQNMMDADTSAAPRRAKGGHS